MSEAESSSRPVLLAVMEPFSYVAGSRNWEDLEEFFNPKAAFSAVHIVSITDNYEYEKTVFGSLTVYPLRSLSTRNWLRRTSGLVGMVRGFVVARRILARENVDVVAQTYGGPIKYGLPAVWAAKHGRIPLILTLHSDYAVAIHWNYPRGTRWLIRLAWKYLFANCTGVRSVSEYIADFAREGGVPSSRIAVIPNKENLETFTQPISASTLTEAAKLMGHDEAAADPFVFLTVGRLIPAKNYRGMLTAFAGIAKAFEQARYVIVGDGPLRPHLRDLVDELGLESRVRLVGFVDHSLLPAVYRLSNVLLFATHYEGQPRVVVEAMLAGLPIICTGKGQVCEIVEHGQDGLWVDPLDSSDIEQAMRRMLVDKSLYETARGHSGFDSGAFSLERVGRQEAAFYLAIAATGVDSFSSATAGCR